MPRRFQCILRALLRTDIRDLFKTGGRLVDDALLDQLLEVLHHVGVSQQMAKQVTADVRRRYGGRVVRLGNLTEAVKVSLAKTIAEQQAR